jgi:uncharacterized surface protein with fasciclin (FAS1) repeats
MSYDTSGISDSDDEYGDSQHVSVVDAALLSAAEMINAQPAAIGDEWGFADDDNDVQAAPAVVSEPVRVSAKAAAVPLEEHLFSMLAAAMLHDDEGFVKAAEHVGDLDALPDEALGSAIMRAHAMLTKGVHQANLKFEKPAFLKKLLRSRKTIVELLTEKKKTLGTLLSAVSTPGQQEPVIKPLSDKKKKFLVFAPIDSAFGKLAGDLLEDLLTEKKAPVLTTLLHGHVVAGEIELEKRAVDTQRQTLSGDVIRIADDNGLLRIYYKGVIVASVINDVQTKQAAVYKTINGTVFLIDRVLMLDSVKIDANGLLVKSPPKNAPPAQVDDDDDESETNYTAINIPGYNGSLAEVDDALANNEPTYTSMPPNPLDNARGQPLPYGALPATTPDGRSSSGRPQGQAPPALPPAPAPVQSFPPSIAAQRKIADAVFSDDEDDATASAAPKSAWFSAPATRSSAVRFATPATAPKKAPTKPLTAPAAPAVAVVPPKKALSDELLARLLKK